MVKHQIFDVLPQPGGGFTTGRKRPETNGSATYWECQAIIGWLFPTTHCPTHAQLIEILQWQNLHWLVVKHQRFLKFYHKSGEVLPQAENCIIKANICVLAWLRTNWYLILLVGHQTYCPSLCRTNIAGAVAKPLGFDVLPPVRRSFTIGFNSPKLKDNDVSLHCSNLQYHARLRLVVFHASSALVTCDDFTSEGSGLSWPPGVSGASLLGNRTLPPF